VEKFGRAGQGDHNIIRRMHSICWTTKATKTHSEYVILTTFPRQRWLHEGASLLRYVYFVCLVTWKSRCTLYIWGTGDHRCECASCFSVGMLFFSARHTITYTRHMWFTWHRKQDWPVLAHLWPTKARAVTTVASSVL